MSGEVRYSRLGAEFTATNATYSQNLALTDFELTMFRLISWSSWPVDELLIKLLCSHQIFRNLLPRVYGQLRNVYKTLSYTFAPPTLILTYQVI